MSNLLTPGEYMMQLQPQKQVSNGTPQQQIQESQINVIELTLLLKCMGFRLNYLEYENNPSEKPTNSDITVEIKCGNRNIVSRLSAPREVCSCPTKLDNNDHNSSFWEIMGTAPSSSPNRNRVADSSSNLLPELSKKGVMVTKNLLALIYDVFRKDHQPELLSPEKRKEPKLNNFVTSTMIKSPKRLITVDPDLLRDEHSPSMMMAAPPNTPKVDSGAASLTAQNSKTREHSVYLELKAAKDRLEKALLFMKINMADDMGSLQDPPLDLCTHKAFFEDQQVPLPLTPIPKSDSGSGNRRASLGAYANIRSRIDTGAAAGAKVKSTLARHKTNVDAGAALKAKSTLNTRANLLLPRKASGSTGSGNAKKVSPLLRTQSAASTRSKPLITKRSGTVTTTVGMGSMK